MKFYAQGRDILKETSAGPVNIASVNPTMLTPSLLAREIADALNAKFEGSQ